MKINTQGRKVFGVNFISRLQVLSPMHQADNSQLLGVKCSCPNAFTQMLFELCTSVLDHNQMKSEGNDNYWTKYSQLFRTMNVLQSNDTRQ